MTKKIFSLLSLVVMMAFAVTSVTFTSCVESGSEIDNPEVKEGDYSARLVKDAVKNSEGKAIADEIIVTYVSLAPDMKTLQYVSGAITLPKDLTNMQAIVLDNHYTITSDRECPSQAAGTDICHIDMVGGSFCVVSTDYIGYGATKGQMHPYLNHDVCARHSIEMAKIAVDILKKEYNITGLMMFNTGYSQGAAVALAVHREMEKNPTLAKQLGFYGSWCGDGPYDVEATTKFYLANADNVSYPAALPLLVEGFLSSASTDLKGNLKFADFFSDKMNQAGIETWMSKREYDSSELNKKMLGTVPGADHLTLNDVYSSGMAVETGALMQKYLQFAKSKNLTEGWTPSQFPLRLFHMTGDNVVPVVNTEHAIAGLKLNPEEDVEYSDMAIPHGDFGPVFYIKAATEIVVVLATSAK